MRRLARLPIALVASVLLLAGGSTLAIAALDHGFSHRPLAPNGSCSAPANLPGTVVNVVLTNMGGPMMTTTGGMMRIVVSRQHVPAGAVSFVAANEGSLVHELVVLPLPAGQQVGERHVGADNRVSEAGSLGEASRTCGAGAGDGIDPGTLGWTTLSLAPGNYELICNLPGHYAAGMYAEVTVD